MRWLKFSLTPFLPAYIFHALFELYPYVLHLFSKSLFAMDADQELLSAAWNGNLPRVQWPIQESGESVTAPDEQGYTALPSFFLP